MILTIGAPALAQSELDNQVNLMVSETARRMGWIQAACTLSKLGFLSNGAAEMTIEAIMNQLDAESFRMASSVKKMVLKDYPECKRNWPQKYRGY